MSWVKSACVGFVRACVVAVVTMVVLAAVGAAIAVAIWWAGNPWSWILLFVLAIVGTLPDPAGLPVGPLPGREVDEHRDPGRLSGGRAGDAAVHRLLVERHVVLAKQ